ncbi:unnamed protein product [Notodromas monacha]|uniref:Solute-binding protein family 3/N-terminal domain-containing protein n=1 Tax=Notodromas monacha TaxID=399045 RepID=A0A7R9BYE4_9CRUS|nr:unnamed protein product [Notodromas monacha]CAG0922952.1 unnamed protein product [Notodromas monacha]
MTMDISRQEYYKKLRSTESSAVDGNNLETSSTRGHGFSETVSELTIAIKLDHVRVVFIFWSAGEIDWPIFRIGCNATEEIVRLLTLHKFAGHRRILLQCSEDQGTQILKEHYLEPESANCSDLSTISAHKLVHEYGPFQREPVIRLTHVPKKNYFRKNGSVFYKNLFHTAAEFAREQRGKMKLACAVIDDLIPWMDVKIDQRIGQLVLHTGTEAEMLGLIFNHLNFTWEWGIPMKNGSFDGLIGELSENRADIVANILAISRARMKFVDFTKPYLYEYTTFVTRKPDEISKAYAIAKPFSDQTLKRKEYSLLWDRLQSTDHRGPGILTNATSRTAVISAVQEKKRAHIVGKIICTGILLQNGLEEMAVVSPGMNILTQMMGVAVRKGSPLLPVVDQMISRMLAAGLIDFWTRHSLAKSRQEYGLNTGPSSKEEKTMALKLEHTYAAFFVLGIGTALSCFVFLKVNQDDVQCAGVPQRAEHGFEIDVALDSGSMQQGKLYLTPRPHYHPDKSLGQVHNHDALLGLPETGEQQTFRWSHILTERNAVSLKSSSQLLSEVLIVSFATFV